MYRDTLTSGFVLDKISKLKETPTIVQSSLTLTEPFVRPRTNAFKRFQSDRFSFAFSLRDKVFSNGVVGYFRSGSLPTGNPFQYFLGSSGAFRLQRCAGLFSLLSQSIKFSPLVGISVRIGQDVLNTQISPKHIIKRSPGDPVFLSIGNIYGCQQVELPLDVGQIRLPLLVLQQFSVMLPGYVVNLLPPSSCPDRNRRAAPLLLVKKVAKDTGIVGRCPILAVSTLSFLIQLVRIRHLANAAYHRLSAQVERTLNTVVALFVYRKLPKRLGFKGMAGDFIASSVRLLKRVEQHFSLFISWLQMYFSGELHHLKDTQFFSYLKTFVHLEYVIALARTSFLPRVNAGGILTYLS